MADINDLLNFAVLQKPNEFNNNFNDIILNKISDAIQNKKIEVAQSMFNEPNSTDNEEEVDD